MSEGGSTAAAAAAMAQQCNVSVAVRGRPLTETTLASRHQRCASIEAGGAVQVGRSPEDAKHVVARACPRFVFDEGFDLGATQQQLFDWVVPAIDGCFEGYNGSIMAYGQTGSGKTHTMGTSSASLIEPEQHGIVPRAFERIASEAQRRRQEDGTEVQLRVSFVEVHDDTVKDLLTDPGTTSDVMIREDAQGEIVLVGCTELEVSTCDELLRLLEQGSHARTTAATLMNAVRGCPLLLSSNNAPPRQRPAPTSPARRRCCFASSRQMSWADDDGAGGVCVAGVVVSLDLVALARGTHRLHRATPAAEARQREGYQRPRPRPRQASYAGQGKAAAGGPRGIRAQQAHADDRPPLQGVGEHQPGAARAGELHQRALGRGDDEAAQRRRGGTRALPRPQAHAAAAQLAGGSLAACPGYPLRAASPGTTQGGGYHLEPSLPVRNELWPEAVLRCGRAHATYSGGGGTQGGNARTVVVACISVDPANFQETVSTLRYAARARNIRNTPVINTGAADDDDAAQLAHMEREMEAMRAELAGATADPSAYLQQIQRLTEHNRERRSAVLPPLLPPPPPWRYQPSLAPPPPQ
jgi:hypothetical protein